MHIPVQLLTVSKPLVRRVVVDQSHWEDDNCSIPNRADARLARRAQYALVQILALFTVRLIH